MTDLDVELREELGRLFRRFPKDVTDGLRNDYLEDVRRYRFSPSVVRRAVTELIDVHIYKTVPSWAALLTACKKAKEVAAQERGNTEGKVYSVTEARELAKRRLRLMNENATKKIPITPENIRLELWRMVNWCDFKVTGLTPDRRVTHPYHDHDDHEEGSDDGGDDDDHGEGAGAVQDQPGACPEAEQGLPPEQAEPEDAEESPPLLRFP